MEGVAHIKSNIHTSYLDVTNKEGVDSFIEDYGNPDLVLFNMVDGQLGEGLHPAMYNLNRLTGGMNLMTSVIPRLTMRCMKYNEQIGNTFFFKHRERVTN